MTEWPLLTITTFLPLIGAIFVLLIGGNPENQARNAKNVALLTSVVTFLMSLLVYQDFDPNRSDFQLIDQINWLPGYGVSYKLGVDGISILFVLLSTFLTPICILSAWDAVHHRVKEYMLAFLVLETMMIGTFCALDMVLFYVFFEAVLIPMYIIIGVWGGQRRVYAAFKFFLYTLLGSVLMLLAILAIYAETQTTDIPLLMAHKFLPTIQTWLWLAFFASFAVKVPMWPVHTWLPDAHVEAPTAGSVILAGVLLKMGGYGFLRFSIPMFPLATHDFTILIFVLSIIAVIYTSLVALVQEDMKKLIAYSSIAHMGFVTVGIFTLNTQGVEGAIFQMLSHGIVSGALFLCVGVVYDRIHSREIARYGGLVSRMPRYALFFLIFTMASIGLPGTSGFVGEFLILLGTFQVSSWVTALTTLGVVLGPAYMLYLYRRVIFGKLVKEDLKSIMDLTPREIFIFIPLILLVFWMGIYPSSFIQPLHSSVSKLIHDYQMDVATAQSSSTPR
jgi:NADH-quinone oxidoreductase subunit M